jgi:SNF2 family DNA or RNA helicase
MSYSQASKRRGRGRGSLQQLTSSLGRHEKRWRVGTYNELHALQHKVPSRISAFSSSTSSGESRTPDTMRYDDDEEAEQQQGLGIFDHVLGANHPTLLARMRSSSLVTSSWPPPHCNHFFSGDIVPPSASLTHDNSEPELSEKMIKDLVAFTIECSRTIPLAYHMDPMAIPRFLGSLPRRELYEHQKTGTLFIRQHLQQGLGCIENDDMRMAKTGTIHNSLWEQSKYRIGHGIPRFSKPDLIVCPIAVIHVWVEELLHLVGPGVISVCVLTTETQPRLPVPIVTNPVELASLFDIIITTYSTMVQHHLNQDILYKMQYNTVVYDEAHELRTMKTQRYKAAAALNTETRICVSGTIFVNHADDVRSLFKLIGVPETPDFYTEAGLRALLPQWCLSRKEEEGGKEKGPAKKKRPLPEEEEADDINVLFHPIEEEEDDGGGITYKTYEEHEFLDWASPIEKELYDYASQSFARRYNPEDVEKKKKASLVKKTLSEIHSLRQMCNSPSLIQEELQTGKSSLALAPDVVFYNPPPPPPKPRKKRKKKARGAEEEDPIPEPPASPLPPRVIFENLAQRATYRLLQTKALGGDVQAVEQCIKAELATMTEPSVLEHYWATLLQRIQQLRHRMAPPVCTKEQRVVNYVREKVEPRGEKIVVFSYWAKEVARLYRIFLERLRPLEEGGVRGAQQVRMVSGDVPPKDREAIWEEFQTNPRVAILLVSLQTGSVGIDLTAANHVFIMDLWWNPQVVEQAIARVKGRKQKRDIHIHYLLIRDTVDEAVLELAAGKMAAGTRLFQTSSLPLQEPDAHPRPAVEEWRNTIQVARTIVKQCTASGDIKSVSEIKEGGDAMDIGY